jgi:hypothetical protein
MKLLIKFISFILLAQTASAQYYYKDIIAAREASAKQQSYKQNRVRSVDLTSKDAYDEPEEGFECQQKTSGDYLQITTYTKSKFTPESFQTTSYTASGLIKETIDTSKSFYSVTAYQFDASGQLVDVLNTSTQTDNQAKDIEEHIWQYDKNAKPEQMIKIKNGSDTTLVHFVLDEKGNIGEERAEHNHAPLQTIYYYYNDAGGLTDIVRYNKAAGRMLPDFIFSYDQGDNSGKITSMIVVPEGSADYQRWVYIYNEKGLRTQETCVNKQKQIIGKILYQYTYSK